MALGKNPSFIRFGHHEKLFNFNVDRAVEANRKIAELNSRRNDQHISDRTIRTSSDTVASEDTASNYIDVSLSRSDTFGSVNRNVFMTN